MNRRDLQNKAPGSILWCVFLLVAYLPPLTVLFAGAAPSSVQQGAFAFLNVRQLTLLGSSLVLAAMVAGVAMTLAVPFALALWRAPWRQARVARWLLLGWIVVPPCVQAMAWRGFFRWINGLLSGAVPLTGWCAAGILQLMAFLPLAIGLAWLGFDSVDSRFVEAARMQRRERAVLMRIALPLAAPGLLAGFGIVFLLSLLDYSLPSLCGVTVYTLDLFAEYTAHKDARQALLQALPVILISASVVWLSQSAFRNAASNADREPTARSSTGGARWALIVSWVGIAALLAFPLLALGRMVAGGAGGATLESAWRLVGEASWVSLRTAVAAALLSIPPAMVVAEALAAGGWRSHLAWLTATLPLAIPPPLVGIGWSVLATQVGWPLHGSSWLPVLAAMSRFLPIAALVLLVARRRLDPLLWDAARVFQPEPWSGFWRIRLPLLRPGVLAAFALVVALTLGELGATVMVQAPGEPTLTVRLYNFLHYGASAHVAMLGLFMALLATLSGFVAGWLLGDGRPGSA